VEIQAQILEAEVLGHQQELALVATIMAERPNLEITLPIGLRKEVKTKEVKTKEIKMAITITVMITITMIIITAIGMMIGEKMKTTIMPIIMDMPETKERNAPLLNLNQNHNLKTK
jgi:hypothetical protein